MKRALIDIIVVPKSSRHEITIDSHGVIKAYLKSPPIEGKANQECIGLFSKALKISKSMIEIDRGLKGKRKRLLIHGISQEAVMELLTVGERAE